MTDRSFNRIDRIGNSIMIEVCEQLTALGWTVDRDQHLHGAMYVTSGEQHQITGKVQIEIFGINGITIEARTDTGAGEADAHRVAECLTQFALAYVGLTRLYWMRQGRRLSDGLPSHRA